MCGIAGVISTDGSDVASKLRTMMEALRHRGPNGAGFVVGDMISRADNVEGLNWESAAGPIALGHTRLAVVGGQIGMQPFQDADGRVTVLHNGEVYNYLELRNPLEAKYRFASKTDSEVLTHLIGETFSDDLSQAVEQALSQCDGVYAVAATDGGSIVIARDPVGVRQLYVVQEAPLIAFASERKALWALGFRSGIRRVMPGSILAFSSGGIMERRRTLASLMPKRWSVTNADKAQKSYRRALESAIAKRIHAQPRIGILFSGGVDSVLVAHLAKQLGARVCCYAAGVKGASDIEHAHEVAQELHLPLCAVDLDEDMVEALVPGVIEVIEDRSLGQVETALPVFASVRAAQEQGELVLLTGQGADELYGGYPWYRTIVEREGYEEFDFRMRDDLQHLYKETLEREDKISMAHSIELRVPFLDLQVIQAAFEASPELKVHGPEDHIGKHVHRDVAVEVGIPEPRAMRPKEAAQHGAGIHEVIERIARRNGFDPELVEHLRYTSRKYMEEQLGSSVRYGHRYGSPDLWADLDHVQLFLDAVAQESDLTRVLVPDALRLVLAQARAAGTVTPNSNGGVD
ncbi:MAG: asparagine synthetase B family protein [Candidatus Methylomirabilales bacterium]